MTRVLVATDGSDAAIAAARQAVEILGGDLEVTVFTVVDVRPELSTAGAGGIVGGVEPLSVPLASPGAASELDQALAERGNEAVERTVAALGVDADQRVGRGDPAAEICRVAGEGRFDLVVVGSHGSGIVKRVLMGSVSHHVIQHAPCPVLVVREKQQSD